MAKAKKSKKTKRNAAIRALKASGIKATTKNINIYMKDTKKKSKKKGRKGGGNIAAMRAGAKKYWAARRAAPGKKKMPIEVLRKKRNRLDQLIKQRS